MENLRQKLAQRSVSVIEEEDEPGTPQTPKNPETPLEQ